MSDDPLWAATVPTVTPPSTPATPPTPTPPTTTPPAPAPSTSDPADGPRATEQPPVVHRREPVHATEQMPVVDRPDRVRSDVPVRRRRGAPTRRRLALRVTVGLVVVVCGYFLVTLLQVWSTGRSSQAREVDAIVVLGAAQYDGRPSPQLQARLDEVVRLWPAGYAPLVVVTGGNQPGDRFTEAEASARYLVDQGIPESAIVYENEGATTFESLEATAAILGERELHRVLLVTDPFHSLRSRLIAEEVGLEAYVAPTSTSVLSGSRSAALHVKEAGGVAIGRLIGFHRLSGLTG